MDNLYANDSLIGDSASAGASVFETVTPRRDEDDNDNTFSTNGRDRNGQRDSADELYGGASSVIINLLSRGDGASGSGTNASGEIRTFIDRGADNGADILVSALNMPTASEIGWHIDAIGARATWADYTGRGVVVAVVDNGWHSYAHPDLDANIRLDLADMGAINGMDHGQNTIGLIGAEANGSQAVGVAFNADLVPELWTEDGIIDATAYADVINNSWAYKTPLANYSREVIDDAVTLGRDGLGSTVVFSAGNYRTEDLGADILPMQSSPHAIVVGATDPDGTATWFSSTGASLLTTAPGIDLLTTDKAAGTKTNFAGTSGSAPIVSGAIALILEANQDLGFRDVMDIVAYSAAYNDQGNATWFHNDAKNWNGGGLHFSVDHGFGLIDVRGATRLAETWQEQNTAANMQSITKTATVNQVIPDGSFLQSTVNVTGAQNILVESVKVNVDIDNHGEVGQLVIKLIAPNGTSVALMDTPKFGSTGLASLDFDFAAQSFRGEEAAGNWTLRIEDTAGGHVGTLADWSLTLYGDAIDGNDTYVYNDQFSLYSGDAARKTLTDAGGIDSINAAMVTTSVNINLNAGASSTIDGVTLTIAGGTTIENAFGGDANDILTGNVAGNRLWGGRGSDTIDGGGGYDIAEWREAFSDFTFSFVNNTLLADLGAGIIDTVNNVEEFIFDGVSYLYSQMFNLFGNSTNNFAPTVTANNLTLNVDAAALASTVITAADADNNILSYEVWDSGAAGNSGYFDLAGTRLAHGTGHVLTQAQFNTLNIVGGDVAGTDQLWVRVSDGVHTTAWKQFILTTDGAAGGDGGGGANVTAPTVTANNLTLNVDATALASTAITAADADGNPMTYEVWDSGTAGNSGYFDLAGTRLAHNTGHVLTQAQFNTLNIVGGDVAGTDQLWVRVSDGVHITAWKQFILTTANPLGLDAADIIDSGDPLATALSQLPPETSSSPVAPAAQTFAAPDYFPPPANFEEPPSGVII